MIYGPEEAEQLVELDASGWPARDILADLLQERESTFAAAVTDGIGYLPSQKEDLIALQALRSCYISRFSCLMNRLVSDKVADIRHHPVLACLDKPILVELADILLDLIRLHFNHSKQTSQWIALFRVPLAQYYRKQLVEPVLFTHFGSPSALN
jgi:hypothetical protein